MNSTRSIVLLCAVVAVTALSGCIKFKQIVLIMPDGSGRMDLTMGVNQVLMQQQGGENAEDPTEIDLLELGEDSEGLVAFTKPKRTVENG